MRKVLIIAYYFPPRPGMGSQRPIGLAKHLPQYGWEPIILTPRYPGKRPEGIKIIETDYKDITEKIKSSIGFNAEKSVHEQLGIAVTKKHNYSSWKSWIIKRCKEIVLFPDDKKGWYRYAYNSASHLLQTENISAIISTSPPIISHIIARKLKQKYGITWVADFRDPWSQTVTQNKSSLIKYFERRMEIKTISYADLMVSVTMPYVDKINVLHKDKDIFCITNGYDDESLQELIKLTSKFTITHTGILYNGKRDPSILFAAVDELIKENKINRYLIEIRFYGPKEDWLLKDINKYNLNGIVELFGPISIEDALTKQKESQLLLVIRWDSTWETGNLPAKIYEYIHAKRPIIAIGKVGGIVKDLLEETNSGQFADNVDDLKNIIFEYYQEFIQNGKVTCKSNNNVKNYSYSAIAKQYSTILDKIIS